jgi:hypothetical protein
VTENFTHLLFWLSNDLRKIKEKKIKERKRKEKEKKRKERKIIKEGIKEFG